MKEIEAMNQRLRLHEQQLERQNAVLAEQKKRLLDAVTRYLPELRIGPPPPFLPGAADWSLDDITIRSMLTHHSGLPRDRLNGPCAEVRLGGRNDLEGCRSGAMLERARVLPEPDWPVSPRRSAP